MAKDTKPSVSARTRRNLQERKLSRKASELVKGRNKLFLSTADGGVAKSEGFTKDVEGRTASVSEKIPPARPGTRTIKAECSSMCKSGVGSIFSTRSLDGLKTWGGSLAQNRVNRHTMIMSPCHALFFVTNIYSLTI